MQKLQLYYFSNFLYNFFTSKIIHLEISKTSLKIIQQFYEYFLTLKKISSFIPNHYSIYPRVLTFRNYLKFRVCLGHKIIVLLLRVQTFNRLIKTFLQSNGLINEFCLELEVRIKLNYQKETKTAL